jgi:transient receptor potential cation channel subfamily A protein 1
MFGTPGEAMLKTFVMMIGEMDFEDIFYDPGRRVYYPGLTYCLFIGFVLVMSIIIMNLLVSAKKCLIRT